MGPFGSRCFVSIDASAVAGAVVSRGLARSRVKSFVRVPLPPGAVVPTAFEANVAGPDVVRDALRSVADHLGSGRSGACVLLPDGVARILLLEVPRDVPPDRYARFRLLPGLPYAEGEAVIGVLPLGQGLVLAAAVRRIVVEGYEDVVAAAGLVQDRMDLAPLAAMAALLREPVGSAPTVDLILGDVAFSLAGYHEGIVRVFRTRRRDPGPDEVARLREEAFRAAALSGDGEAPRLRVVGSGAASLIQELLALGTPASPGWKVEGDGLSPESAELAWLGGALG